MGSEVHGTALIPAGNASGNRTSGFRRFFGQDLLHVALLVGLAAAIAGPVFAPIEMVKDPDVWWHLADARILTSTHHFIRVEPYSFAVAGERWIDPEWLSELPYWFSYSALGLRGIHLAMLAGLWANLLFVYFRCKWKSRSMKASLVAAVLAFFLMTINTGARTIVVAYLALSAEMAILEASERGRKQLLWLLPPLFCLWINLHGSWIIGLCYLGAYIACGWIKVHLGPFEQEAFSRVDRNRLLGVFLASTLALMANPYGWRLIWNPFDMLANQRLMLSVTEEWKPLSPSSSTGIAAVLVIGATVALNLWRRRKWKVYELAFMMASWGYAFAHQRFAYMAAIVTIPWLAADLAQTYFGEQNEKTIPLLNALIAVGVAAAIVFYFPSEAALRKNLAEKMPLETIASIQPSWRTFSDYFLGGVLAFESKPDFVDSRNDTFEHHGIFSQFLTIENTPDPFGLLDSNHIDHVLTRSNSLLGHSLEQSREWRLARREGTGDGAYEFFERVAWAMGQGIGPAAQ